MANSLEQNLYQNALRSWDDFKLRGFVEEVRKLMQVGELLETGSFGYITDTLLNFLPAYGDKNVKDENGDYNERYFQLNNMALDPFINNDEYFNIMMSD